MLELAQERLAAADLRQHLVGLDIVGDRADTVAERMVVADGRGRREVEDEEGNLRLEGREPKLPAVVAAGSRSRPSPEVRLQSRIGYSHSETQAKKKKKETFEYEKSYKTIARKLSTNVCRT